jgi:hypothetical protein
MAAIILDKRMHRTVRLSTSGNEINLSKSPDYKVLITADKGVNSLSIFKKGLTTPMVVFTSQHIHTPPATGTPLSQVYNANSQMPMNNVDPGKFVVFEIHHNLPDDTNIKAMVRTKNPGTTPDEAQDILYYWPPGVEAQDSNAIQIPFAGKIPPQLG